MFFIIEIINSTTDVALEAPTVLNMSENIDDRIANLLIGGSGISINYDDSLNTITISNTYNDGLYNMTFHFTDTSNNDVSKSIMCGNTNADTLYFTKNNL